MTIKTLTFIHDLLKEDVHIKKEAHNHMRDIVTTARANNQPNADFLAEQQNKAWNKYLEANRALEDFEEKEW